MQKNKKTFKDFDFTELSKPKIPKNLNITQKIRQAEIPFDESQQDAMSDRGSFKSQFSKLSHNQNQAITERQTRKMNKSDEIIELKLDKIISKDKRDNQALNQKMNQLKSNTSNFKQNKAQTSDSFSNYNDTQGKIKSLDQTLQFTSKNVIQQRINKSQNSTQHTQFYTSRNSSMSLASDENYFIQDDYETSQQIITMDQLKKKKNYFITFRWKRFMEFLFYHLLYYILFGPFSILIFNCFKTGKILLYNLQFLRLTFPAFTQLFTYLINAYIVYCYFLLDWQHYYYYGELMYVGVAALMRCASISFKYATYDQYQYFRVKNQFLNLGSIGSEIILQQWFKQTSEVQFEEIYFQMRRHEVDDSLFFVAFMVNPTPNQLNLIQKNILELADYSKKAQFQPEPVGHQVSKGENQFLFGYGILKLLLDHFHKRQQSVRKRLVILAFVMAILRNSIPFLTRFQESKHVLGSQISENIGIILTAFVQFYVYCALLLMVLMGIYDMQRKNYLMEQLAFMLSPRKLQYIDDIKIFPSINIFSHINLKGWMLIRKVAFDYGEKFFLREQYNLSMFVIFVIFTIPVQILQLLNYLNGDQAFTNALLFDMIFFSIIIFVYLYYGAKINHSFTLHQTILRENKAIIDDIFRNRSIYFKDNYKNDNYLYNKAIKFLKTNFEGHTQKKRVKHLRDLQLIYKEFISELQNDEQMYPLKIFGITIRFTLLKQIGVGILSVVFTFTFSYYQRS